MRRSRRPSGSPWLPIALLALGLLSSGCRVLHDPWGCGRARKGGGPVSYRTRPQEMCELARRAAHSDMKAFDDTPRKEVERIYRVLEQLHRSESMKVLVERVREAAGDPIADGVASAAEWVRTKSRKPWVAEKVPPERQLINGASSGLLHAFEERFAYLGPEDHLSD
jgi:hypothetical protein